MSCPGYTVNALIYSIDLIIYLCFMSCFVKFIFDFFIFVKINNNIFYKSTYGFVLMNREMFRSISVSQIEIRSIKRKQNL